MLVLTGQTKGWTKNYEIFLHKRKAFFSFFSCTDTKTYILRSQSDEQGGEKKFCPNYWF